MSSVFRIRRHRDPKIIERNGIEESVGFDNLPLAHPQDPCVAIDVGLAVACNTARIKMCHDGVTVGINPGGSLR